MLKEAGYTQTPRTWDAWKQLTSNSRPRLAKNQAGCFNSPVAIQAHPGKAALKPSLNGSCPWKGTPELLHIDEHRGPAADRLRELAPFRRPYLMHLQYDSVINALSTNKGSGGR